MKPRNNTRIRRSSAISEPQSAKRRRRPSDHTEQPATQSYVPIHADIVHPDACASLRRHAAHWRGVSALAPVVLPPDHIPPPTALRQLPSPAMPFTNPDVLPPAFALHTTAAIPANSYIAPFTSTITPSSSYLADPLNAYAHLGMPKPFVHLIGPPLDLALDARLSGHKSRFVRSGCRPNAVLRPTLCQQSSSLSFGVFALRDLKPNEEVILGWEWDDGNVVHSLPALIETPQIFPHPPFSSNSPHQIQHIRHQMANILHALSSTFTTCACGEKAKDCALNQMAAFVEANQLDHVDLGPLVGKERGFRTREKLPLSSGMGGVEMDVDEPIPTPSSITPPRMQRSSSHTSTSSKDNTTPLPEPDPPDQPLTEDHMPPKFRKKWKQQHRKPLHSPGTGILNVVREMPPPPLPSSSSNDLSYLPLTSFDGTSPSTSFSRLSLASTRSANVDDNTPSPYQPWAPFARKDNRKEKERKEDAPPPKADRNDENKMDIDANSHDEPPPPSTTVEETPRIIPSPSPRSPPITLSSRSRSRSQSARSRSRSASSTAITTPPSPREPKLPDIAPPPPTAPSSPPRQQESAPEIVVLVPEVEDEPIRDSPESPPQIVVDLTSRSPSPIRPTPSPPPRTHSPSPAPVPASAPVLEAESTSTPPPALDGDEKEDGEIEDEMDMQVDAVSPKTPPRSPVSETGISLPSTTTKALDSPVPTTSSTAATAATGDKATGETTTPSAPATKVKLSLKDFAARKKKLREDGVDTSSGGKTPVVPNSNGKKVEEVEVPGLGAGTGKGLVGVSGTGTAALGDTEKKASSVTDRTADFWTGRAYNVPYSTLPSSSTKSDTSLSMSPSSSTWTSFASSSTSTTSTSKSLTQSSSLSSSLSTAKETPSATIKTIPPPKPSAVSTLPLKLHSEMLTTTSASTNSKEKAKPSNPWSSALPILSSSSTSTLPSASSTSATTSNPSMSITTSRSTSMPSASKTMEPVWFQTKSSPSLPSAEDQIPYFGWGQVPAHYRSLFSPNVKDGDGKTKSEWEKMEKERLRYEWNVTSKSGTNAAKNVVDDDVQAKQEPVEPTSTATTTKVPIVNGWKPSFSPSRDEAESSSTSSTTAATTTPSLAPLPIGQPRKPSALSTSSSVPSSSVNIPTSPRIRPLQPSLPTGPRAMNAMTRGRPPPPSAPMAMSYECFERFTWICRCHVGDVCVFDDAVDEQDTSSPAQERVKYEYIKE
ncbi:SET domain-containing protein 3 [Leucoagaricus sp. SymC.cos]|nr:SET domain-containing protein 3 [Leucoagaricus sp. SymC.cos]